LHKIFSDRPTIMKVDEGCRSAGIGCIECKSWAADALVSVLNPMQERRKKYEDNPRLAWDILEAGSSRASKVAGATMNEVREAMGMTLDYEASATATRSAGNRKSGNNGVEFKNRVARNFPAGNRVPGSGSADALGPEAKAGE